MADDNDLPCIFCGGPIGSNAIADDHGNLACKSCGEAEIEAQKEEGFTGWN